MDIDKGDSPPIACRPYTLPLKHHDWVKKEIEILDRAGIIDKSISAWASPVIIVPKKSKPGEPPKRRMCVDFRRLNGRLPEVEKMTGGKGCISLVPLPKIDELYARLQGYKIFSTLDLRSGYYHIGLSESAKPKTAFVISGIGKYQFNKVLFRLAQALAYFQTLVNKVLDNINFAMGYLDDIIIFSRSEEEHFHRFLKTTVGKQIQKGLEWDDLVWKATSAYNFFPTESSGISPFFLMFGCEAAAKHMLLAEESTIYLRDNEGILNLKLMQQLYHVIAYNLAKSRTT